MQEAGLVLEQDVQDGAPDRWCVVNVSEGINHRIDHERTPADLHHESVRYTLVVTGDELEGKVIIVVNNQGPEHHWEIFRIEKVPSGLAVVPVGTRFGDWYWENHNLIFHFLDARGSKFYLSLDSWGVATALEYNWSPSTYWIMAHGEADIPTPDMAASDPARVLDKLKICWQMIAAKEKIARLEDGKNRAERSIRSFMGKNKGAANGQMVALLGEEGAVHNIASRIREHVLDACDALGIELGPDFVGRLEDRQPSRARR